MSKTWTWIIVIVVVILGIYLLMRGGSSTPSTSSNTTSDQNSQANQNTNPNAEGRVVFAVTDAAVDMTGISEVNLMVSKVEVHHSLNGWATVSTTPKTYSLLALNAKKQSQLLVNTKAKVGTYDQVRLTIDSVSVRTTAGVTKTAKLPSNTMAINTMLAVSDGNTSSVNLDFMAKSSLHTTTLGDYIFAPVVKTQTQSSAVLTIDSNGVVSVTDGRVDDTNTVGMDIDGSVKVGFIIDDSQKLNVDTSGKIKVQLP